MKFHEIDTQGKVWCERLSTLPTWEASFIGRLVYNTTSGILYYADNSQWMPIYIFQKIAVAGQTTVEADDVDDTLTLVEGNNTTITTSGDNITIGLNAATNVLISNLNNFLTSGRKLWIYEDTAPTGWTIVAGTSDALLAVKGGTEAYNVSGGVQRGTWTLVGHTHTVSTESNHTHTTPSHALTIAELPAHTHTYYYTPLGGIEWGYGDVVNYNVPQFATTGTSGTTGSSSAHAHGDTGGAGGHNHTTSNQADVSSWRMLANVGIIVEKD